MGRFRADEVDNYGGQGGGGFFSIRNDKETKKVRFMYNDIQDVEGYAVHQVEVDGKKRYVNCLRSYDDPVDKCPFCAAHLPQYAKLFIPVYDVAENKVKWWERGKKYFAKMSSLCSRYATETNLVQNIFEIERNGKQGDTNTTYEIWQIKADDTQLEDLEEVPPVLGTLVLDKTADEMDYYLENGDFAIEEEAPKRRSPREVEERPSREMPRRAVSRRVPGDRF